MSSYSPLPSSGYLYGDSVLNFASTDSNLIIGKLASQMPTVSQPEIAAWTEQIEVLKSSIVADANAADQIYFEFKIPRLGRRIDNVLIRNDILYVIEFKTGESEFSKHAMDQVWDYALDLVNFHSTSEHASILPVLIATGGSPQDIRVYGTQHGDAVARPVRGSKSQILDVIAAAEQHFSGSRASLENWESGRYSPTSIIVEAAKALYAGHGVEEISRSDSGAVNLRLTASAVSEIIHRSQREKQKAIVFVTGVPGAGKTLVGLDVATKHSNGSSREHSVFLSGNGPLVSVLTEALARDRVDRAKSRGEKVMKGEARSAIKAFIQIVHHFRDACLVDKAPPVDHVSLFDEAQRAWNRKKTSEFMRSKKNQPQFDQSEPQFLISCMDRHKDWAVVVCLIGEGQEINDGEGGVSEWTTAVREYFPNWQVYLSPVVIEDVDDERLKVDIHALADRTHVVESLHLSTSMRSFRAENLSNFVRCVLELEVEEARAHLSSLKIRYPIVVTRDLSKAKSWVKEQARGSERFGMVVSSKAQRLRPISIDVRPKIEPIHWFLHPQEDVRSSNFLEDAATEFVVQGLELDWACVVWDGDMRISDDKWSYHEFKGTKWQRVKLDQRQRYQKNAYRVLLTRARQGMVLVIPEGDPADPSRNPNYYDGIYRLFQKIGVTEI